MALIFFSPTVQPPSKTFNHKLLAPISLRHSLVTFHGSLFLLSWLWPTGSRSRGTHLIRSLIPPILTSLPCALRIPKHLVYCTTILTAHNTEQLARLRIERTITYQIRNHSDERRKRWRGSVTTCLSMCEAVCHQIPQLQLTCNSVMY